MIFWFFVFFHVFCYVLNLPNSVKSLFAKVTQPKSWPHKWTLNPKYCGYFRVERPFMRSGLQLFIFCDFFSFRLSLLKGHQKLAFLLVFCLCCRYCSVKPTQKGVSFQFYTLLSRWEMVRTSRGLTTSRFQRNTHTIMQKYTVFVHFYDPSARSKHQFVNKVKISKRNLVENWPTNQHQKLEIWETQKHVIHDLGIRMVAKTLHFQVKLYFLALFVDSGRSASASLFSKNIHFF